jgi:hypothetical protein
MEAILGGPASSFNLLPRPFLTPPKSSRACGVSLPFSDRIVPRHFFVFRALALGDKKRMPFPEPKPLALEQDDLPEPLPYSFRNCLKMMGPAVILLASAIGGGEWLAGPALAVQFGTKFMWIATVSIIFQVLFNLEAIRYTLYTGEPIFGGFMKLKPGAGFWAIVYSLFAFLQLGWPALAGSAASTLFAGFTGRLAGDTDARAIYWLSVGLIVAVLLILSFGGTIEKMLERLSYFMMGFVFLFLLVVNVLFIPAAHWGQTLLGFFQFSGLEPNMDWALLATFAATAGSGGLGNLCLTSWVRDKGFGMARYSGAIPSAVGGREVKLSHQGKTFPVTPENLRRWRVWWKFLNADQIWIWGLFAFLGMFLNVNLATGVIPHQTDLSGLAAGAYQAKYMAGQLWRGFWFLALLNGFWILFSTHLGNTDILVRTITDMVWMGSSRLRAWRDQSVRKVYYSLLIPFSFWALIGVRLPSMNLLKLLGNMAGLVMIVSSVQIFWVNRKFLPRQLRSPWREWSLILCAVFYLIFLLLVVNGWFRG